MGLQGKWKASINGISGKWTFLRSVLLAIHNSHFARNRIIFVAQHRIMLITSKYIAAGNRLRICYVRMLAGDIIAYRFGWLHKARWMKTHSSSLLLERAVFPQLHRFVVDRPIVETFSSFIFCVSVDLARLREFANAQERNGILQRNKVTGVERWKCSLRHEKAPGKSVCSIYSI